MVSCNSKIAFWSFSSPDLRPNKIEAEWTTQLNSPHMSVMNIPDLVNIDQSWMKMMPVKSGKVAQNKDFVRKINIFQCQCTQWRWSFFVVNNLFLLSFDFASLFNCLFFFFFFTITIWQKDKPGHPKEGSWWLILFFFLQTWSPGKSSND